MAYLICNQQRIELTDDGFLQQPSDWNEDVGLTLAEQTKLTLSEQHWQVIYYLRKFHQTFAHAPTMRALVNGLKQEYGSHLGNSLTLQQLFPGSSLKEMHRLAGLAKPPHCV